MRWLARLAGIACLALSVAVLNEDARAPLDSPWPPADPPPQEPAPEPPRTRQRVLAAIAESRSNADFRLQARLADAVRRACDSVGACVATRKEAIPAFTDDCFSLGTTWKLLWASEGEGRDLVRQRFERHVISPEWMERLFVRVAADFADDARAAQDDYLLAIAADVEDVCVQAHGAPVVDAELGRSLAGSLRTEVRACAGLQVANSIVTEVVLAGVARFLIARGAIAAGAATSWCTFGIGLVVGIVVDYFICLYCEREAAGEVAAGLDELGRGIVDGTGGEPGLRATLEAEARRLRRALEGSVQQAVEQVVP
ncbi:MAG: hypothetical protein AAB434_00175 [Planctomycetota bacterium]